MIEDKGQLEMTIRDTTEVVMTASQAGCLDAIRLGRHNKTHIAVTAKLYLKQVGKALLEVERLGLIKKQGKEGWHLTERGRNFKVAVQPDPQEKRGSKWNTAPKAGSSAERLLNLLDKPSTLASLAPPLNLTIQGVRYIVVRLLAQGLIRHADDGGRVRTIAKCDDPTVLLSKDEERVLSVAPEKHPISKNKLRLASKLDVQRMEIAFQKLLDGELLKVETSPYADTVYILSLKGRQHPQRDKSQIQADRPQLKVKSERVFNVLSFLKENGEARIVTIQNALGISQKSMNAQMQYLKRLGLVKKSGVEIFSPYILTKAGVATQAEMMKLFQGGGGVITD